MPDCASCGEPITDSAYVCRLEADRSARRWREAADLWPHVAEAAWRQTRIGERGRGGSGHEQPLPVDLPASDARWSVANTVQTWARHVAQETGADLPAGIASAWRWLAGRTDWLRYRPYAGEVMDELDDAAALVWRTVDLPPVRSRIPVGPCPQPDCAGQVTAVVPAREQVPAVMSCGQCGAAWGVVEWRGVGRRILARMREA